MLGPRNRDLCHFVAKFVFVIFAFFGINFFLRIFCSCKRNDKYEVWWIAGPNCPGPKMPRTSSEPLIIYSKWPLDHCKMSDFVSFKDEVKLQKGGD